MSTSKPSDHFSGVEEEKTPSPPLAGEVGGSDEMASPTLTMMNKGIKVTVKYAETGDAQVLYFSNSATVEELKRQTMEYAEHGVNCKVSSMILLQSDGTSLVKASMSLSSLSTLTVFVFSRDTLLKTYTPTVALEDFRDLELNSRSATEDSMNEGEDDISYRQELAERCLSRCRVQIEAGSVALKNLMEHSKSVAAAFVRFHNGAFAAYTKKADVLSTFDADLENLARVPLAKLSSSRSAPVRTMLESLPKDKIKKWAEEASRQHDLIVQKYSELTSLAQAIEDGCESVRKDWSTVNDANTKEAHRVETAMQETVKNEQTTMSDRRDQLDQCIVDLKQLKANTTRSLFSTLLRSVSSYQSKIQDLSNKTAALKEGIIVQEQKVSQVATIRALPEAYDAALREAERRRQFAISFSSKITQLTDYVAKERDRELDRRELFNRQYGKILPPDLVPGLSPWVFPVCEVTQRPIDPVLFANVLDRADTSLAGPSVSSSPGTVEGVTGEVLFEADTAPLETELTAMEILELQAENEFLKGKTSSPAIQNLKSAYEREIEQLMRRVEELEIHLSESSKDNPKTDTPGAPASDESTKEPESTIAEESSAVQEASDAYTDDTPSPSQEQNQPDPSANDNKEADQEVEEQDEPQVNIDDVE